VPIPTATTVPTPTATPTPVPTATPLPPTATPTPEPTDTPVPPAATAKPAPTATPDPQSLIPEAPKDIYVSIVEDGVLIIWTLSVPPERAVTKTVFEIEDGEVLEMEGANNSQVVILSKWFGLGVQRLRVAADNEFGSGPWSSWSEYFIVHFPDTKIPATSTPIVGFGSYSGCLLITLECLILDGTHSLIAQDGQALGLIATFGVQSVCGVTKYEFDSIRNRYGLYGGDYGLYSPYNSYSLEPPIIVDSSGVKVAYVTNNRYFYSGLLPTFDPDDLLEALGCER
jgi:hypothetical protein